MERHRWCLAALGLVCSVFFLATQAHTAPVITLIFCCVMLVAGFWLRTLGIVTVLFLELVCDFHLDTGEFPWQLLAAQGSLALCTLLANALLIPQAIQIPIPEVQSMQVLKNMEVKVPEDVQEMIQEKIEFVAASPKQELSVHINTINAERLDRLNQVRVALWEQELLNRHLTIQIEKQEALLKEKDAIIIKLQERIDYHPAQIAYRELRKQFAQKSDTLHQMRQQMFALEGELLILQREQEQCEEEKTQIIAGLMQALGNAEKALDNQEEHIITLEGCVNFPPFKKRSIPKHTIRRKKVQDSAELATVSTLPRNRKKRSTESVYFGELF